jgi:hypothetical protein
MEHPGRDDILPALLPICQIRGERSERSSRLIGQSALTFEDRLFDLAAASLAGFQGQGRQSDLAKPDNPRLDPNLLGDRSSATPDCRQKNNLRSPQIALQFQRERQQVSSIL